MLWCVYGVPQLYFWIQISFGDGRIMEGKKPHVLSNTILKGYLKLPFLVMEGVIFEGRDLCTFCTLRVGWNTNLSNCMTVFLYVEE